jgi:hypothetical protein
MPLNRRCLMSFEWPLALTLLSAHPASAQSQCANTDMWANGAPASLKASRDGTHVPLGWKAFGANSVKLMRRGAAPKILGSPARENSACIPAQCRRDHVEHKRRHWQRPLCSSITPSVPVSANSLKDHRLLPTNPTALEGFLLIHRPALFGDRHSNR